MRGKGNRGFGASELAETLRGGREAANEISDILIRAENDLAHPASKTRNRCVTTPQLMSRARH
jgi:hypothetical protein